MAWLAEVLGNCPSASDAVRGFDALLYAAREEDLQALRPDLVITVGGHVVSKRLKQFLRRTPSLHWHVSPDGLPADLFCALTTVVEASPADFFLCFSGRRLCRPGRMRSYGMKVVPGWPLRKPDTPRCMPCGAC